MLLHAMHVLLMPFQLLLHADRRVLPFLLLHAERRALLLSLHPRLLELSLLLLLHGVERHLHETCLQHWVAGVAAIKAKALWGPLARPGPHNVRTYAPHAVSAVAGTWGASCLLLPSAISRSHEALRHAGPRIGVVEGHHIWGRDLSELALRGLPWLQSGGATAASPPPAQILLHASARLNIPLLRWRDEAFMLAVDQRFREGCPHMGKRCRRYASLWRANYHVDARQGTCYSCLGSTHVDIGLQGQQVKE